MDIADVSGIRPDTADSLNAKEKSMTLIDLLNMGIKNDIKINRVYSRLFNSSLHHHISFNIGNCRMDVFVAKTESIIEIKSGDNYDLVSMKREDNVFTFSFVKDGVIKNLIIKNCMYLGILIKNNDTSKIIGTYLFEK